MFDSLKGMAGMAGMLRDLPRIKARMAEIKRELERVMVESQIGGGAVRVIANGHMRIISIRIDPSLMASLIDSSKADNRALAEDLIAGAVNGALEKAKSAAANKFGDAARELNLPIPPGGLEALLG